MKKAISVFLSVMMLVAALPAHAAKSDMEEILASVKERIGSTEQYDEFDWDSYEENGGKTYNFWWQNTDEGDSLSVTVTESKIISSYYEYSNDYGEQTPHISDKNIDDIYDKAVNFVKQLNPQLSDNIKVEKKSRNQYYLDDETQFTLKRIENGIPVEGNTGHIVLTDNGNKIDSFYMNYTEGVSFETPNVSISLDEAKKIYAEKIGWTLHYGADYKDDEISAKPMFMLNDKYMNYISAKTGEIISLIDRDYEIAYREEYSIESEDAAGSNGAWKDEFSEAEQNELDAVEGLISEKEAEKIVRNNSVIAVPYNFAVKSIRGYKSDDRYCYSLTFAKDKDRISASVDATTGEIFFFYKSMPKGNGKIAEERAIKIAEDALKTLTPQHTADYLLDKDSCDGSYSFVRNVNGIPFYNDSIDVSVDMGNGNVTWYSYNFSDIEFPSIDNVLSDDEFSDIMFSQNDFEPFYVLNCSKKGLSQYNIGTLVYKFDDNSCLWQFDAVTGKSMWSDNVEATEYTDVSGHYAENAISTLAKYGIGYNADEYKPSEPIKQKEITAFTLSVFRDNCSVWIDDDYDYSYDEKRAKKEGIISAETYDPDGVISREETALLLAKTMRFNEYAEIDGIYNCPFADVTKNIGQISILSGLKILNGDGNGNFNPEQILTRGDFAVILYNCLTK